MDIVEVFWDARPALRAINAKVGGGDLSPDVQALFAKVRAEVSRTLEGSVALTRIITNPKAPEASLAVRRNGAAAGPDETHRLTESIQAIVDAHVKACQEAKLLASA